MRAIPDDNLAYPMLITLESGVTGSGFFLNSADDTYLVTARHVLLKKNSDDLLSDRAELTGYSRDFNEAQINRFALDLQALKASGSLKPHHTRDVVIIHFGHTDVDGDTTQTRVMPGITITEVAPLGVTGVASDSVKLYDQVLMANDIIVFGYPTSLGLQALPQLDLRRPLLRKGIVAGLNPTLRSIILECAVYPGNSGGPVIEIEQEGFNHHLKVIGVVSEFVPYADVWRNTQLGYTNTTISNSGYSVATPMDFVLELLV